jgi:hypothetical protein
MRNDLLNDAVEMIRAAGFEPHVVYNKHVKVYWADSQGRRHCLVVSVSPSDRRARTQSRAVLRRLLKAGTFSDQQQRGAYNGNVVAELSH